MKLATRNDDTRDGQLTVISRDLKQAVIADGITGTLQRALDDWQFIAPQLQDLYERLNQGRVPTAFDFNPHEYLPPLPRAFQCLQADAYPAFVRRLKKAGLSAAAEADADTDADADGPSWHRLPPSVLLSSQAMVPLRYPVPLRTAEADAAEPEDDQDDTPAETAAPAGQPQAGAPSASAAAHPDQGGLDFSAQLVAICDDLPVDLDEDTAERHILLLGLANAWSIQPDAPISLERRRDRGLAFAPVVITPDELGEDWRNGIVNRPIHCRYNGRSTGRVHAGHDMRFDFRQLLAALSRQQPVVTGCLVSTGPIANEDPDAGWTSLLEARARRVLDKSTQPGPAFMQAGDRIRIDMSDARGQSLFGSIEQVVVP